MPRNICYLTGHVAETINPVRGTGAQVSIRYRAEKLDYTGGVDEASSRKTVKRPRIQKPRDLRRIVDVVSKTLSRTLLNL